MMQDATGCHADVADGRWVIAVRRRGKPWEVIIEPNMPSRRIVAIAAYPLR